MPTSNRTRQARDREKNQHLKRLKRKSKITGVTMNCVGMSGFLRCPHPLIALSAAPRVYKDNCSLILYNTTALSGIPYHFPRIQQISNIVTQYMCPNMATILKPCEVRTTSRFNVAEKEPHTLSKKKGIPKQRGLRVVCR
ncbi:hypothetical protein NPIL_345911 [Nephila pilipes]|uniref:Uncharacterized protein n=1 Tax=Nephila pilipes TaxID=299642 RepID=A0A8X6QMS5_NEPPI|nr:hypothetical protein NPIL_75391 [Nephila pilipes]GFU27193.1 hypothetical protein NPIL_345911 [Nephila pilipes]